MKAPQTPNERKNYTKELDLTVDYNDGDIVIFDHVKELAKLYPLKPTTNLVALCSKGSMQLEINGRSLELHDSDVFVCPSNSRIDKYTTSEDFECKVLSLSNHIVQGLLRDKSNIWNQALYVNQINIIKMSEVCKDEFNYYYSLICSKIHNRDLTAHQDIMQTLVKAMLLEICLILEQLSGKVVSEGKKLSQGKLMFNRFLEMVSNSEVKRRPINYYADQLAITPKYLTMLCLKYSDKTASDWIIQYTTEDIRFFLKNTSLSIKEISAKLGFSNMSHFGSYVRKHLGMSPSTFRHGNVY
jgi:AraC-like DNA-binding protein